jgi:pimeloyl-ACP methyl ester carboxylesterase
MQDVLAVMDAAGSRRAALMGTSEGGNLCMLFAATYPERTAALVLHGSFARGLWSEDYPWGKTREQVEEEIAVIARDWGGPFDLSNGAPSLVDDREARDWFAGFLRNSASPQDAISLWRWNTEIDVRGILGAIPSRRSCCTERAIAGCGSKKAATSPTIYRGQNGWSCRG